MGDTLHTKNLFVSNVFSDKQNSSIEINSAIYISGNSVDAPNAAVSCNDITVAGSLIKFNNIPTSDDGLESGQIWSNNNVLTIVP